MNVKEAVVKAKNYVQDTFVDEQVSNLGLEEVVFDEYAQEWNITIGFSRPWNTPRDMRLQSVCSALGGQFTDPLSAPLPLPLKRSYKVVRLDNSGKILSLRNRSPEDAVE